MQVRRAATGQDGLTLAPNPNPRYAEPGEYEVLVGASCVDIRLRAHLTLTGPARSEVGGAAVEAGYRTLTLTRTLTLSLTLTLALIPTLTLTLTRRAIAP